MKRLILIRHAKSSWGDPGLSDLDRPLNNRGNQDAPFMGKRLKKEHNVKPDLILSSPAKRAIGTARIIAKAIGYPGKKNRDQGFAVRIWCNGDAESHPLSR
ncbi:histidine phosphatase family protein [candidate division KSB1 bacterium]|nr:histidine phosphatase family protein [candidate division KSB1 bacterium]